MLETSCFTYRCSTTQNNEKPLPFPRFLVHLTFWVRGHVHVSLIFADTLSLFKVIAFN